MFRFSIHSCRASGWVAACIAVALVAGATIPCQAQIVRRLTPESALQRFGLARAWTAQVELDRARHHVVRGIFSGDRLFVLTSAGLIHALDAETGETLWTVHVGNADYESLGPAADDKYVALVNGSTLFVLDRESGALEYERPIGGAPGAGPALSNGLVFVPLFSGRVEGYRLHEPGVRPWYCQSHGQTLVTPLGTPDCVAWSTSEGWMYVADTSDPRHPKIKYRLEAMSPFDARPAYRQPTIYAVSAAGELFAMSGRRGKLAWKYVAGFPSDRSPAVVGSSVYMTCARPALHCVDAATGLLRWEAEGVSQFAAAGKSQVYGIDPYGAVVALDGVTGATVARMLPGRPIHALVNDQTDRLYLFSEGGLIQCLHEIGVDQPVRYQEQAASAAESEEGPEAVPPADEPPTEPAPAQPAAPADENPFAGSAPAGGDANPFGAFGSSTAPAEPTPPQPAAAPPAEENPFSGEDENPFDF